MSGRVPSRGRLVRAALIALAAVLTVVGGAAAIFIATFDANRWKPRIAAAVERATGRQIALSGPIGLKLSLQPTIEASDVALANPSGFSRPDMAKIGALDLQLDLLALLHGSYVIERLVVEKPDLLFERNAAGRTNWATTTLPAKSPSPRSEPFAVKNFAIRDGLIGFRDAHTGKTITVAIGDLGIDAGEPASGMRFRASAKVGGLLVTVSAETGSLERLLAGPSGPPIPVKARFEAGGAALAVDGTVGDPLAGLGYRIAVRGSIPDLAVLADLAGMKLPGLKRVVFSARLAPTRPIAAALQSGLAFEDLKLTSAQGDLSGKLNLRLGERPGIDAELSSTRLDADALFTSGLAPGHPAGKLIPDTPLPIAPIRAFDADLRFLFADVTFGGQHWRAAAGRLVVADGKLRLDPFAVTAPGGKLAMTLALDATQPAPPVALSLRTPSYSLAALLAAAGSPVAASGEVAITADLRGAGASPHAIAATLNGSLVATMSGGRIDDRALGGGFGKILATASPSGLLGNAGARDIRCMKVHLAARNGVATLDPFVLVSTLASVEGSGTLALGPETMNLVLRPHGSVAGKSLSAAVAVRGSFKNPQITTDAAGTAAAIGGLAGQFAGKNIPLPGLTQTAAPSCAGGSAGGSPATPARTTPQLPNPSNLLKNLFR